MVCPIVFLPGLLCNRALFIPQTENLSSKYLKLVSELSHQDSVAGMARHVLDRAPQRFSLVGFSMGGYVAFEVMRQDPDRVDRLILIDTSARPDDAQTRRQRTGMIALARRGRFNGVSQRLLPRLVHPDRLDDTLLVQTVYAMAADIGRDGFIRQQTAILGRPDSRPLLAKIARPTLVICGRQDVLTPVERSEEIASDIKSARLAIIEDAGHLTPLEQPDDVTDLVADFLDEA